jgi:hypothetical protein
MITTGFEASKSNTPRSHHALTTARLFHPSRSSVHSAKMASPFDLEDLVHLRALLGGDSPQPSSTKRSTLRRDARRPGTATTLTREEKQREKYRNRYHNRIVRKSITAHVRYGILTNCVVQLVGNTPAPPGRSRHARGNCAQTLEHSTPRCRGRKRAQHFH